MRKLYQSFLVFLQKPFLTDYRTLFALWMLLPVIATLTKFKSYNNFLIFRYVFWHTIDHTSLYTSYEQYYDTNHYGPFFSLVIAPFAIFPEYFGLLLYCCPVKL